MLDELNRVTKDVRESRNEFITRAIERALDGKGGGYVAGFQEGWDRGFRSMFDRSEIDRECLWDALELVRGGMDIIPAVRQALEGNRRMRAYEASVKAGRGQGGDS